MKPSFCSCLLAAAIVWSTSTLAASAPLELQIRPKGQKIELTWPGDISVRVAGVHVNDFEVQESFDLREWQSIATVPALPSDANLRMETLAPNRPTFYRVRGMLSVDPIPVTGEQLFGHQETFEETLARLGQLSLSDFQARFTLTNTYLERISWDPSTALFWTNFNGPPKVIYAAPWFTEPIATNDFRLSLQESNVLSQFGFVVSERMGAHSFAEIFYRIYSSDLPVFVSSDAILQAWHRSYAELLQELEYLYLLPAMSNLVIAMHEQLPEVWASHGTGPLSSSIVDVDYFLTVARCLFTSNNVPSKLGQETLVQGTLAAINHGQLEPFVLFDRRHGLAVHMVDFSRFIVRGYYTKTAELRRYFRGMSWLSLVDFRVAGNPDDPSPRELGSAIVLRELLSRAGQESVWSAVDQVIRVFVGVPDSMGFTELNGLLAPASVQNLADITRTSLTNLQQALLSGKLGIQTIQGHALYSPYGPDQLILPRSFSIFGLRFVVDSWALNNSVFDRIIWDENGVPEMEDKVGRRMPSALDVAFSVLRNDVTVPELARRIADPAGLAFRDGLPYQHNLAAVRLTLDAQRPESWDSTLYTLWLAALRELSGPTTDPKYPEAMRTRAWAQKTLSTQLASWAQLRHNSVLYAKESMTPDVVCSYPYGFVEPRVEFWRSMRRMANRAAELVQTLPYYGEVSVPQPANGSYQPGPKLIPMSLVQSNHVNFLTNFSATMLTLETISEKELNQEPLTTNEVVFLQDIIELQARYASARTFTGWYPQLFYIPFRQDAVAPLHPSDQWDALVTSVHTDQPSPLFNDPGGVLHEGVGNVNVLMIAIDNGPDRMLYAGPVLSYYEFATVGINRLTDQDWKNQILQTNLPPVSDWERDFKVPGQIIIPSEAR